VPASLCEKLLLKYVEDTLELELSEGSDLLLINTLPGMLRPLSNLGEKGTQKMLSITKVIV
jgi:hypothetical protein